MEDSQRDAVERDRLIEHSRHIETDKIFRQNQNLTMKLKTEVSYLLRK